MRLAVRFTSLEALLANSDVVSLHLPLGRNARIGRRIVPGTNEKDSQFSSTLLGVDSLMSQHWWMP